MLISDQIREILLNSLEGISSLEGFNEDDIEVTLPTQEGFGDYSSSILFSLAKARGLNLRDLGEEVIEKIKAWLSEHDESPIKDVELVNGGFLNFYLSDEVLTRILQESTNEGFGKNEVLLGKTYVVEYTDPNPFKVFHIGHLMTNTIGESLARLFAAGGADVKHVNYQGDVGMHVAKSIWGLLALFEEEGLDMRGLADKPLAERQEYLGRAYAKGASAYKEDESAAVAIKRINMYCYIAAQDYLVESEDWQPQIDYKEFVDFNEQEYGKIKEIYRLGREWSLAYFETIYSRLGTNFDNYYFESKAGEYGLKLVRENEEKGIFTQSEGAVIFRGEDYGLHTRVFINKLGLPVYEAKDLGLALLKYDDYKYDRSVIVTANEINDYFEVVIKALSMINPELAEKTTHVGHGMLNFKDGKMSSRTGRIISGEDLLDRIEDSLRSVMTDDRDLSDKERDDVLTKVSVGAWKYSVLKQKIGRDIPFDFSSSLSLEGRSGPYLQYTYARCKSVLRNTGDKTEAVTSTSFDAEERKVLQLLERFPVIVLSATQQLAPHTVATYLYDLAQSYNSFYNTHRVLVDEKEVRDFRLTLTKAVAQTIKTGLGLLGIETVEKM
ncbi:arginine--tRNA ligase [candidate division WWE3 bacterium]|uniref:Arginine--tRNA ligase n=1 Tax=candidate division WWE3 bacterium TaxID=2053526 RepID=A0A955RRL0_UNCKA|nr:arginine--tRNA ligase [candidate division WWE3 bacterium]